MATETAGQRTASRGYALVAPRTLAIEEWPLGELAPRWVRLRFLYCGLCGSDLSHFEGRPEVVYPLPVGHEFLAEIVEVGSEVERLAPGDLVTSDLNYRCGICDQCKAGRSHLCDKGQEGHFTNRAFADFGDIEETYLLRLSGPAEKHLSLSEPLSCVLHAKQWASLCFDDRVLVIGAGGIGLCMAFALCKQRPAFAFEITDLMPERLARIGEPVSSRGKCVETPAGTYDVVFDLSGAEEGLERACAHVRGGGRICSMSHPNGEQISPFLVSTILRMDVTFTASYLNGEPVRLQEAGRLLEQEWDETWDDTIELLPLEQLPQAYEQRPLSPWCKTIIQVSRDAG